MDSFCFNAGQLITLVKGNKNIYYCKLFTNGVFLTQVSIEFYEMLTTKIKSALDQRKGFDPEARY